MAYKLMASWDIKSGYDQQYFEFMVREWVPSITQLGLQPREAWFSIYGEGPQIMTSATTETLDAMRSVLHSEEWAALHAQLMELVENYQQKVVRALPTFQI